MISVLNCITVEHNLWLVLLAALVCLGGAWVTIRLVAHAGGEQGLARFAWNFLSAVAAGASIWSTHFIAMLSYESGVAVSFDPVLTIVSLIVAIVGADIAFVVATMRRHRAAAIIGGALLGLSVAAMHYIGMRAYLVSGLIEWKREFVVASVVLAVVLGAIALDVVLARMSKWNVAAGTGLLVTAIVLLHFTGMAGMRIVPFAQAGVPENPEAFTAMALAVAFVGVIVICTAVFSYLIDHKTRWDSSAKLRFMALNDSLTGLPNRTSFTERLKRDADSIQGDRKLAVIGIDLDNFKEINDTRGHACGDRVLCVIAQRMKDALGQGEYVARIGGDEFTALKRFTDRADLDRFITGLRAAFAEPIDLDEFEVRIEGSFGIAVCPQDAVTPEDLVNNADLAMYRAKTDSMHQVCFYEPQMDETIRRRRQLASDLRHAIDNDELKLVYQVQTSVASGSVRGFEALLRWTHPRLGNISPGEFIPLAEENGVILPLGDWVLRRACQDAATWENDCKVAVNLSAMQFSHANLPQLVHETLLNSGLAPHRLELELTETTVVRDKQHSLHVLRQIKALGVSVALDDFGTGYSSLETLRSFPFDKIKLDRSFMSDIDMGVQSKAIIRAVLALGKCLEIPILAEGVETLSQLELLQQEGCDEAQGFYLGRPVPLDQLQLRAAEAASAMAPTTSDSVEQSAPLTARAAGRG